MNSSNLILNVAEKPSVAKTISNILSGNTAQKEFTHTQFNPVWKFDYKFSNNNEIHKMIFTSVSGHIMEKQIPQQYSQWGTYSSIDLYECPIITEVKNDLNSSKIVENINRYAKKSRMLIIWTDCDREGENIGFEIINIATGINKNLFIRRAVFSALTPHDVFSAADNLQEPNKNLSDAVEVRQIIDLIIGSSFTRLQTVLFKEFFFRNINQNEIKKKYISYGPCLFPTLFFIVIHEEDVRLFVEQEIFYIEVAVQIKKNLLDDKKFKISELDNGNPRKKQEEENKEYHEVIFNWINEGEGSIDQLDAKKILEKCETLREGLIKGEIIDIQKTNSRKFRPVPLNTIEFAKLATKQLKFSSHKAMEVAEKLYQRGFISYPRTETQIFPYKFDFKKYLEEQTKSEDWGNYVTTLINEKNYFQARKGTSDDKSHPPIYPVKFPDNINEFSREEKLIFELISRHYIACLSDDAEGESTNVILKVKNDRFKTQGLVIKKLGFLEIYKYQKWSVKILPEFHLNEIIPFYDGEVDNSNFSKQFLLYMEMSKTTPPELLTESQLIGLMNDHGIGTDATIPEHIKNVQEKGFAKFLEGKFSPTPMGMSLIFLYNNLNIPIYDPDLRASMEETIKRVAQGDISKDDALLSIKEKMKVIFIDTCRRQEEMKSFILKFLNDMEVEINSLLIRANS